MNHEAEERRAKWEHENGHTFCSACHYPAPTKTVRVPWGFLMRRIYEPNVCPHCVAKMIGGTDE